VPVQILRQSFEWHTRTDSLHRQLKRFFLMTAPEHASTSSRLVREIARYGGPLERLVPHAVIPVLTAAARRRADVNG